jgi:hypothetical protein
MSLTNGPRECAPDDGLRDTISRPMRPIRAGPPDVNGFIHPIVPWRYSSEWTLRKDGRSSRSCRDPDGLAARPLPWLSYSTREEAMHLQAHLPNIAAAGIAVVLSGTMLAPITRANAQAASTFQNSCRNITIAGNTLSAECRRMDGSFTQTPSCSGELPTTTAHSP